MRDESADLFTDLSANPPVSKQSASLFMDQSTVYDPQHSDSRLSKNHPLRNLLVVFKFNRKLNVVTPAVQVDHFETLATRCSDIHCRIKGSLY